MIENINKMLGLKSNNASLSVAGVSLLFIILFGTLVVYDNKFKNDISPYSNYPQTYQNTNTEPKLENKVTEKANLSNNPTSLNNDLLPKNSNSELIANNMNIGLKDLMGSQNLRDTRNANLQLRADPPIRVMDTGPFNMSTITGENKSTGLDICKNN